MLLKKSQHIILNEDIPLGKNIFLQIQRYIHDIDRADWGFEKPPILLYKNTKGKIINLLGIKYVNLEGIPFLIPLKKIKNKYSIISD